MSSHERTTDLSIFQFKGTKFCGCVDGEGMSWWVGKDVCQILGLRNTSAALARLDADEKDDIISNDTIGRLQTILVVNEPGLYRLIFQSRKREAKEFQRVVFHDILPQIRRTGTYGLQDSKTAALPPARPREQAEISEQLTALWMTLKRQDLPPWMDGRELAAAAEIPYSTARHLAKRLFDWGLLDLEESHPRHLYRLAEQAIKRNPAMYKRLDLHTEIIKARKQRPDARWRYDDL